MLLIAENTVIENLTPLYSQNCIIGLCILDLYTFYGFTFDYTNCSCGLGMALACFSGVDALVTWWEYYRHEFFYCRNNDNK